MSSLYIPRAMSYTTIADVEKVFNTLFNGNFVKQVDERMVNDSRGQPFKTFYVHFNEETSNEMDKFYAKMKEDGMVQVMTGQGKWFWKVYINTAVKLDKPIRKGPRIMTEEDEQLFLQWKESRNMTPITSEDIQQMEEVMDELEQFTEEELDELDAAYEEEELMALATEMAKEKKSYADAVK